MGYDWKIGIAIVSSFAAREVFVGTLATIYNVGTRSFYAVDKNGFVMVEDKVYNYTIQA